MVLNHRLCCPALAPAQPCRCKAGGAQRMAYPPVVAGGADACTIHYSRNDKVGAGRCRAAAGGAAQLARAWLARAARSAPWSLRATPSCLPLSTSSRFNAGSLAQRWHASWTPPACRLPSSSLLPLPHLPAAGCRRAQHLAGPSPRVPSSPGAACCRPPAPAPAGGARGPDGAAGRRLRAARVLLRRDAHVAHAGALQVRPLPGPGKVAGLPACGTTFSCSAG